jgi:hypothetical protein
MGGEERDVIGDRALDALRFHVRITIVFRAKLCPLPGNCANIRRWREQLFHERRTLCIDERHPAFAVARGKPVRIRNSAASRRFEGGMPIQARPPIIGSVGRMEPCVLAGIAQPLVPAGFGQRLRKRPLAADEYWPGDGGASAGLDFVDALGGRPGGRKLNDFAVHDCTAFRPGP